MEAGYTALQQGSNLTVARSLLATENDDGRLKTHGKVARLADEFCFNYYYFYFFIFFFKYYSGK